MKTIAIVMPMGPEQGWHIREGVIEYVSQQKNLSVVDLGYSYGQPQIFPNSDLPFDAAITWADYSDKWVASLWAKGVPVVNCGGDWLEYGIPTVKFDNQAMCRAAIDHLAERRPACVAFVEHRISGCPGNSRRRDVFNSIAADRGLTAHAYELTGDDPFTNLARRMFEPDPGLEAFLRSLPRPAGVWCGDYAAVLVCRIALQADLRIPQDLAVLGLRNTRAVSLNTPAISSIAWAGQQLGYAAAQRLHGMLQGIRHDGPLLLDAPPVIERESTSEQAAPQFEIRRALELIQERGGEGLTVKELLQTLSISAKTFTARFRQAYGISPGDEIRRVRLEKAKSMLMQTDLPVTRVALLCGFDNVRSFNLFFKRETGMSPSRHRAMAARAQDVSGRHRDDDGRAER